MRIVFKRSALEDFWKARFVSDEPYFEGDRVWKGVSTRTRPLEGKTEGQGNYLELPHPLESVGFNIVAQQKRIQYCYEIYFRDPKILKNLSSPYQKVMALSKNTFCPTTDDLTGYILDAEGNCYADVISSKGGDEEVEESRLFSFGKYGSRIREYEKVTDLIQDVTQLSTLVTSVIQCCIDKHNSTHKTKKINFPYFDINMGLAVTHYFD